MIKILLCIFQSLGFIHGPTSGVNFLPVNGSRITQVNHGDNRGTSRSKERYLFNIHDYLCPSPFVKFSLLSITFSLFLLSLFVIMVRNLIRPPEIIVLYLWISGLPLYLKVVRYRSYTKLSNFWKDVSWGHIFWKF